MKSQTYQILRNAFKEYYFRYGKSIQSLSDIKRREFAFRYFGPDGEPAGMVRHLTFDSDGEVIAATLREVPSDLYCSNGYYRFPSYPMHEKEWLGADLIFDIDTKDLHLSCQSDHSYYTCESCSQAGKYKQGSTRCQNCNSQNVVFESIPCETCLDGAKNEVEKLLLILVGDFGIGEKNIEIYFSGNDGYHVHVANQSFRHLDAQARSDIAGYILGKGLMPETIGVYRRTSNVSPRRTIKGPGFEPISNDAKNIESPQRKSETSKEGGNSQNDFVVRFPRGGLAYGWQKRLSHGLSKKDLIESKLKNIVQQRGGYYGFRKELERLGKELGVNIDPQVTMDVHRVFRLPGSLNSKSGLTKMKCSNLDSFNPLEDACLLNETDTKVKIKTSVKLTLKGRSFRIDETTTSLPAYAAIYLVCKKLAIII
ncbi:MAG TPA: DNA primase small subunit domain-containing protein [Nitrososphaeraceae archaeon]